MKLLIAIGILLSSGGPAHGSNATVALLENGLEVVLIENHGSPMIASAAIVRAGADRETGPTAGASHMLEHLLFNGTERRTQQELYDETDRLGMYSNATTRRDHTVYFILAPNEHAVQALDIQQDMLFHSTLPPEKFEKERGIVIEEIGKDEQSSSHIAELLFRTAAFGGTPYSRPVLGTRETIRGLDRASVWGYYQAVYVPNNMTLLITGDFETDEMLRSVRDAFGDEPGRKLPPIASAPKPPQIQEGGETVVYHGESDRAYFSVAFPALPGGAEGEVEFNLAISLLSERLSSALTTGGAPLLFDVGLSYQNRPGWGRLVVSGSFESSRDEKNVIAKIREVIRDCQESGFDKDEVRRFVVSARTQEIYLAEKIHYYGMMKAADYASGGQKHVDASRLALAEANHEALSAFIPDEASMNRWYASFFLPGEADYDSDDLAEKAADEEYWMFLDAKPLPPQEFRILASPATETGDGNNGSAGRGGSDHQPTDTTLANGLRLVIDSNDDSEVFALHMLARNRSWQEPEGLGGLADALHRMLLKGAAGRNENRLREALDDIGADVKTCDASYIPFDDYYTTPEYSFIRFTTIDEYAEEGARLFAGLIAEPLLDESAWESVQAEKLATARGKSGKPADLSRQLLSNVIYAGLPLQAHAEGTTASIEAIGASDIESFHDQYFAPDNLIISCETSLPAAVIVAWFGESLGRLETFGRRKPPPPSAPRPTVRDTLVEAALGGTQGYVRIGYSLSVPEEDQAALRIAVSILSSEMAFDLREEQGLAYSIGAGVGFHDGVGTITAAMGTSPENIESAIDGMSAHFDRLAASGAIDQSGIEVAVNSAVGRMAMRRLSRPNQAYRLGLDAFRGTENDPVDALRAVKVEDVKRVAESYLRRSPAVTVVVR